MNSRDATMQSFGYNTSLQRKALQLQGHSLQSAFPKSDLPGTSHCTLAVPQLSVSAAFQAFEWANKWFEL